MNVTLRKVVAASRAHRARVFRRGPFRGSANAAHRSSRAMPSSSAVSTVCESAAGAAARSRATDAVRVVPGAGRGRPESGKDLAAQKPRLGLARRAREAAIDQRPRFLRRARFELGARVEEIHDGQLRFHSRRRGKIRLRLRPFLVVPEQFPAADEEIRLGRLRARATPARRRARFHPAGAARDGGRTHSSERAQWWRGRKIARVGGQFGSVR